MRHTAFAHAARAGAAAAAVNTAAAAAPGDAGGAEPSSSGQLERNESVEQVQIELATKAPSCDAQEETRRLHRQHQQDNNHRRHLHLHVLVHGLSGKADDLWYLGQQLEARGFTVRD